MFRRRIERREQVLAGQLRREARATRPSFSPLLHTRIRHAIDRCEGQTTPATRLDQRRFGPVFWLPVAAVAAGLMVAAFAWRPGVLSRRGTDRNAVVGAPTANGRTALVAKNVADNLTPSAHVLTDLPDRVAVQIDHLITSTVMDGQWAYLDQDAQRAARALIDPLPLDLLTADEPAVDQR